MPNCLQRVWETFQQTDADFIGSDDFQFFDKTYEPVPPFSSTYGWRPYQVQWRGKQYWAHQCFQPNPSTMSHINTMPPDHVKVFRRELYEKLGGHDKNLKILDDLDLLCRVYSSGAKWVHIPEALYAYRVGNNSWEKFKQERFALDFPVYSKHIIPMIQRWCRDKNLPLYDICSWRNPRPGFIGVDILSFPNVIQADLNKAWPFEDNSVGCISATDAIEHLSDKHHTMSEIYRVLAPGGYFVSYTPHGLSEGGISDPTHRTFWNSRTFRYYDDAKVAQYIGNDKIRFRPMWDFTTTIDADLKYVTYHAIALKGGEEELESRGERRI